MDTRRPASCHALPYIRTLHPYVPGLQPREPGWIKLNTNENPYPPSPRVAEAVSGEVARLRLYPDPSSLALRQAVAHFHGLQPDQVLAGNGSDDTLNLLVRVFCREGHPAGWTVPSYSLYPTLVAIQGADMVDVALGREMVLPVDRIVQSGATLFFLTSPNAPTGVAWPMAALRDLLTHFDGMVVLDEAYVDFADETAVPLLAEFPNLVVTRTFSKSYGLAGLRVGYALAAPETIDLLERVRDSYNLDRLAQAGALAALSDRSWFESTRQRIIATRERTQSFFEKLGWFTYPSQTNFVFVEPASPRRGRGAPIAADLFNHLNRNRILVRHFASSPLTDAFLRISIGRDEEMDALFAVIESWIQNA